MRHAKKEHSVIHTQKKSSEQNLPLRGPRYWISRKRFKATVINIFKEPKKTMLKEVRKT